MECARRGESWKQNALTLYPISASEAAAELPAKPVPTTMTSMRRLLAGFTRLMWFLCEVHFSAKGPDGILDSSMMVSDYNWVMYKKTGMAANSAGTSKANAIPAFSMTGVYLA